MVLTSKEEYMECRNRNNPKRDESLMFSKNQVADDYQCTETKAKRNEIEFINDIKQQISEVWDEL